MSDRDWFESAHSDEERGYSTTPDTPEATSGKCICNHEHSWHRYDCPLFTVADYGINAKMIEDARLGALLAESRKAVQPMVDREAEAERWPSLTTISVDEVAALRSENEALRKVVDAGKRIAEIGRRSTVEWSAWDAALAELRRIQDSGEPTDV